MLQSKQSYFLTIYLKIMFKKTIQYTVLLLIISAVSACANIKTEPSDDGFESRQRNGGEGYGEKIANVNDRFINRQISKVIGGQKKKKTNNDELKARLERLERQQAQGGQTQALPAPTITSSSDITAPPIGSTRTSPNIGGASWQNSASYQDWKRAKDGGSSDYKEFQEYKEWLEFKKLQQQNK